MKIFLNKRTRIISARLISLFSPSPSNLYKLRLQAPPRGDLWRFCSNSCQKEFVEELERESMKYQDEKGAHLCVHINQNLTNGFPNTVAVGVHGFLGNSIQQLNNPSCQLKLKINLTLGARDVKVNAEIPLVPVPIPGNFYDAHEACVGSDTFYENKSVPCDGASLDNTVNLDYGTATVDVVLTGNSSLNAIRPNPTGSLCIIQKIREEEVHSDVAIVASNGTQIKCHKAFLAVHSPVFAAMLDTKKEGGNMKECQTNRIEMDDMSEATVRAFLAYLYTWESKTPNENSAIALELLKAGHKYDIPHLEKDMGAIFIGKSRSWCTVETAFQLFLFVRNVEGLDELKKKAVDVLKLKSTEMLETKCYMELVKENPSLAAEVSFELFAYMNSAKSAK